MARAINRRRFLQHSAAAGAALAFSRIPLVRAESANNKLRMAFIGTGGRGGGHLGMGRSENVLAICDCDENQMGNAAKMFPKARTYTDYRKLFDEVGEKLDAVVVSTPDHSHAPAAMRALLRDCHVYCEKPLTYTVEEARRLTEEATKRKLATQMGNQGHANDGNRRAVEWVRAGVIGDVQEIHVWTNRPVWPQGFGKRPNSKPVPDKLNWDAWIGPAPWRDYHDGLHRFSWRGYLDFGTGAIGDMGAHTMDGPWWSMMPGAPKAVELVKAVSRNEETYPKQAIYRYEFEATQDRPAFVLYWYEGGLRPERPAELGNAEYEPSGSLYVGSKGKIISFRDYGGRPSIIPREKAREVFMDIKAGKIKIDSIERSPGHSREWLMACKGEKPWDYPKSNFSYAGPLTEAMLLGNVALRVGPGKKLEWDPKAMRFTNAKEADTFIRREYRKGWELEG